MFLADLSESLHTHRNEPALLIEGTAYSYGQLSGAIMQVRHAVRQHVPATERVVALVANDDLLTYASIIALWFEGKAYTPLAPSSPPDRNRRIFESSGASILFSSDAPPDILPEELVLRTDKLSAARIDDMEQRASSADELAYLLFTSGTTGQPKGVPITMGNLSAFLEAHAVLGAVPVKGDRCLQMFELTFDLSVVSYLQPLLHGACVCTVPKDAIKYAAIAELIEDHRVTHALMVPSIINLMRPYLHEVDASSLRFSLFCGEALPEQLARDWAACASNASILNVYGPTEHTIYCTHYAYERNGANKAHHGVLCIGKAMAGSLLVVRDGDGRLHEHSAEGELCLSGAQLTPGYWNDAQRTEAAFFSTEYQGRLTRFYLTGDLCRIDPDGDILYLGRTDQQVKVQGYRVELPEIEHHARRYLAGPQAVALTITNASGNTEIALVIESTNGIPKSELIDFLRHQLPAYMVPAHVLHVAAFPLNANGKTDRKALRQQLFGT
ncbi:MAG: amino acid adenylation domain-containing protein [Flavobacteriales bacterium]|nr:amino acid adenylation domain-containing protein [Flavobacteriales bacterium]